VGDEQRVVFTSPDRERSASSEARRRVRDTRTIGEVECPSPGALRAADLSRKGEMKIR
jgi:hypothetical protein